MLGKLYFRDSCVTMVACLLAVPVSVMAAISAPPAKTTAAAPQLVSRPALSADLEQQFRKLDANKDGYLAQAEIAAGQINRQKQAEAMIRKRREAAFAAMDKNKDGQLSRDEFLANNVMAKAPAPNGAKALARLDSNKDGRLTLAEYTSLALSNFDRNDSNHDAVLSPEEMRKPAVRR